MQLDPDPSSHLHLQKVRQEANRDVVLTDTQLEVKQRCLEFDINVASAPVRMHPLSWQIFSPVAYSNGSTPRL